MEFKLDENAKESNKVVRYSKKIISLDNRSWSVIGLLETGH